VKFLVQIEVQLPPTLADEERRRLLDAELQRGRELLAAGRIESIWRVPGGLRNVGIWDAEDATALHELLSSLPLYRWLRAEVTALAEHPATRPPEA
jgi:muconolactone D-isomerase